MASANNLLFHRESNIPAGIALDDLSRATIPTEYFRSLLGDRRIATTKVSDLPAPPVSKNVQSALARLVTRENGPRCLLITDEADFNIAATEFILSRVGTVVYLTPATIALFQIRNTLRGSPSVLSLAEESDYVFIGDLCSAHQRRLFDAEPTAAAHFYEFLRAAKYGFQSKIIFGSWRSDEKMNLSDFKDELILLYPDSLVDLITVDMVIA